MPLHNKGKGRPRGHSDSSMKTDDNEDSSSERSSRPRVVSMSNIERVVSSRVGFPDDSPPRHHSHSHHQRFPHSNSRSLHSASQSPHPTSRSPHSLPAASPRVHANSLPESRSPSVTRGGPGSSPSTAISPLNRAMSRGGTYTPSHVTGELTPSTTITPATHGLGLASSAMSRGPTVTQSALSAGLYAPIAPSQFSATARFPEVPNSGIFGDWSWSKASAPGSAQRARAMSLQRRDPQQTIGHPNSHAQSPLSAGAIAATPSDARVQGSTDVSTTPPGGVPTRWWGGGDIPGSDSWWEAAATGVSGLQHAVEQTGVIPSSLDSEDHGAHSFARRSEAMFPRRPWVQPSTPRPRRASAPVQPSSTRVARGSIARSLLDKFEEKRDMEREAQARLEEEQSQGWHRVKESVEKATKLTLDVIHDGLETSLPLLDLVPVPLVQSAAHTLLMIWSNLQSVDMNRLQCLRLTERCADILISIANEIEETADGHEISSVAEELKAPLERLVDSFKQVNAFLERQSHRPFLKRYLKRDEILKHIQSCDASLGDALGMFSLSIQIRTLKQVQESERRRQEDTKRILESMAASNRASAGQGQATTIPVPPSASSANALPSSSSVSTVVPSPSIPAATSSNLVPPLPRPPIMNNSQTTLVPPFPDMAPADGGAAVSGSRPATVPEFSDVQGGFAQDVASGPGAPMALQGTGDATLWNSAPLLPPSLIGLRPELIDRGPPLVDYNLDETIEDTNLKMPIPEIPQPFPSSESLEPPLQTRSRATSHSRLSPADIREIFNALRIKQSQVDQARDSADLRGLMRAALQTTSDAELIAVLQVGRDEMPEAIKTLQRALERLFDGTLGVSGLPSIKDGRPLEAGWDEVSQSPPMTPSMTQRPGAAIKRPLTRMPTISSESSSDSSVTLKDTLDREFMESGIDALRRLSRDQYPPGGLPSWTITRYEIDRDSRIGMGFFSDVYKGTWRGRTVAIKLLAETTPRGLFIREVEIWKTLKHRNVLELYGASSAVGSGPWFFVSPYLSNGSLVQYLRRLDLIMSPLKSPRLEHGHSRSHSLTSATPAQGPQQPKTDYSDMTRTSSTPAVVPRPVRRDSVGMGMLRATLESSVRQSQGDNSVAPTLSVSTDSGNDPGDLLRFMHETAKGMEYLHSRGVLHGDLKAANVLVDDNFRCVISDFGQSEMRSEVYRLSNTLPSPHGTLRWQSPELMSGQSQRITNEMDIYAYAICCIEVLSMGRLPWPHQDDDNVRYLVLKNNARPPIPNTKYGSQGLTDLINACWDQNPFKRPSFSRIAKDVKMLRRNFGVVCESDAPTPLMAIQETFRAHPSPDMMPIPLPGDSQPIESGLGTSPLSLEGSLSSYRTANESHASASPPSQTEYSMHMHREDTVQSSLYGGPDVYHVTEPVLYTSSSRPESSIFTETETSGEDSSLHAGVIAMDYEGYDSPPPLDERLAELRDERRYRILLSHEFHPSLTLPLWTPTHVLLGAVGYLLKPAGRFVSLFNAFNTEKSTDPDIMHWPSVYGYGTFRTGSYRHEKRSAAQRGLDAIVGFLTFKNRSGASSSQNISRRYSYPMRAGHKMAILCTETTTYHYVDKLDAPKKWFMANVDAILAKFGPTHHIQKEDLYLIVGKLDAPNYALFVSHSHPDGQAHFNVFSSPRSGLPWGTFTTDTEVNGAYGGPSYQEPVAPVSSSKISTWGGPWDSVLLARLRFKPDVLEPTSL